jgi:hypothetical protein
MAAENIISTMYVSATVPWNQTSGEMANSDVANNAARRPNHSSPSR